MGRRTVARISGFIVLLLAAGCQTTRPDLNWDLSPAVQAEFVRASEQLEKARRLPPDSDERRDAFMAARDRFNRVVEMDPEFFEAQILLQDTLIELDFDDAWLQYQVPEDSPTATAADLCLAARLEMPRDMGWAAERLVEAIRRDDRFAWSYYGLAYLRYTEEDSGKALELVDAALERQPNFRRAIQLRAELLEIEGRRDEALTMFEYLLEYDNSPDVRQRYARVLLESDEESDARRAEQELQRVLADLPDPATEADRVLRRDAYLDLGVALSRQGRSQESLRWFRKALEVDPNLLPAYYNIGWVLETQLGRNQEALQAYEEYLRRAERWEGPFPTSFLFDRWLFVDKNVRELRIRLGLDPDTGDAPDREAQTP